eukprot:m.297017 g.297017  ORF g.297017 m.297017 type:complete len:460 (+) comp13503_c0_seq1:288-1667(+)
MATLQAPDMAAAPALACVCSDPHMSGPVCACSTCGRVFHAACVGQPAPPSRKSQRAAARARTEAWTGPCCPSRASLSPLSSSSAVTASPSPSSAAAAASETPADSAMEDEAMGAPEDSSYRRRLRMSGARAIVRNGRRGSGAADLVASGSYSPRPSMLAPDAASDASTPTALTPRSSRPLSASMPASSLDRKHSKASRTSRVARTPTLKISVHSPAKIGFQAPSSVQKPFARPRSKSDARVAPNQPVEACPNRANGFHTCSPYCYWRWVANNQSKALAYSLELTPPQPASLLEDTIMSEPYGPLALDESDQKRVFHNERERMRRSTIRVLFEGLRKAVPAVEGQESTSDRQILLEAAKHIDFLSQQGKEFEEELVRLRIDNLKLKMLTKDDTESMEGQMAELLVGAAEIASFRDEIASPTPSMASSVEGRMNGAQSDRLCHDLSTLLQVAEKELTAFPG